jgi:hypothetical protein
VTDEGRRYIDLAAELKLLGRYDPRYREVVGKGYPPAKASREI